AGRPAAAAPRQGGCGLAERRPLMAENPIPWAELKARARSMTERSYAPYSHVHVGAAALVDDGRIVEGCNLENASYGLSLCAECSLASNLVGTGGGRLVAL